MQSVNETVGFVDRRYDWHKYMCFEDLGNFVSYREFLNGAGKALWGDVVSETVPKLSGLGRFLKANESNALAGRAVLQRALTLDTTATARFSADILRKSSIKESSAWTASAAVSGSDPLWRRRQFKSDQKGRERAIKDAISRHGHVINLVSNESGIQTTDGENWLNSCVNKALEVGPTLAPVAVVCKFSTWTPNAVRDVLTVAWLLGFDVALVSESPLELGFDTEYVADALRMRVPVFYGDLTGDVTLVAFHGIPRSRNAMPEYKLARCLKPSNLLNFNWLLRVVFTNTFAVSASEITHLWGATIRDIPLSERGYVSALLPLYRADSYVFEQQQCLARSARQTGHFALAEELLEGVPRGSQDKDFDSIAIASKFSAGKFEEVVQYVEDHKLELSKRSIPGRYSEESKAVTRILSGLHGTEPVVRSRRDPSNGPRALRYFSILHACAPFQSGGYANRAHQLLRELSNHGYEGFVVTRPGFEASGLAGGEIRPAPFDGVDYHVLGTERQRHEGEYRYMEESVDYYYSLMSQFDPDVVHLRSSYPSALPGLIAARRCGVPVLYEVSGMWELVFEGKAGAKYESKRARSTRLENEVLRAADKVATLTDAMADIVRSRVALENTIEIIPNAVNSAKFDSVRKDLQLSLDLGLSSDTTVIGYAGSFVDYEGLDVLIEAVRKLSVRNLKFALVLVGDGQMMPRLQAMVKRYSLEAFVKFTGRVSHAEVQRFYSLFEICVFPRHETPATRAVSPLKPFEAFAAGKQVVVSDVQALYELSGGGERASVFPAGDSEKLAAILESAIREGTNSSQTAMRIERARTWVRDQHSWEAVGAKFATILRETANINKGW